LQTDIDSAEGVWLDHIGEIVGISRIIPESVALKFFGFQGQESADTFGEEGNISIGSRFRDENESYTATSVLADPEYRLLIRAKIVKNHSTGTQEDVLEGLSYLFDTEQIIVQNLGNMEFTYAVGRNLTFQERVILNNLDILARPATVEIRSKIYFDYFRYFGFEDQPNAMGFGDELNPDVGGIFSEEF
jgi:hypothetical protein